MQTKKYILYSLAIASLFTVLVITHQSVGRPPGILKTSSRTISQSSTDTDKDSQPDIQRLTPDRSPLPSVNGDEKLSQDENSNTETKPDSVDSKPQIMHMFNTMEYSFAYLVNEIEEGVPTKKFLTCAKGFSRIFDKLSSTAFAPVKSDFLGNVQKIERKWMMNSKQFDTLQKIINFEISKGQHTDPNSATQALLWLTRGLYFLAWLMQGVEQYPELSTCVTAAYEKSLKPFHNFVVRGVVSIATKAAPYKEDFVRALAEHPDVDADKPEYKGILFKSTKEFANSLFVICDNIADFYRKNQMTVLKETS